MDSKHIILAAHRGDRKYCPENTMPAFEAALKLGCDMIETDLQTTADGELVIMHDRNAKRTTGVDRNIDEMTLAEVMELDAGALFSEKFRGTGVPTVKEFIARIKDTDVMINWELKSYPKYVGDERSFAAADKLVEMIIENGLEERSMLNSFSDRILEHCYKKYGKRFPIHGQGIYHCPKNCDKAEINREEMFTWCCMYSNDPKGGFECLDSPENFTYCVERGIKVGICIGDTVEKYKKAIDLGCRMFTSNDIYAADAVLRELGER